MTGYDRRGQKNQNKTHCSEMYTALHGLRGREYRGYCFTAINNTSLLSFCLHVWPCQTYHAGFFHFLSDTTRSVGHILRCFIISLDTLCSSFSKFFTDKITLIRSNFFKNDHSRDFPEPPHVENKMDQFTHTTTSEVRSIILKSTNASCDLDPFPTRLLKHYIDDLIIPITAITNLSMREGVVPPDFEQALVTPLIKKKTLCRNEFKNYRPISNLSFLSNILEKIVAKRLNAHIEEHLLSNHLQSAYKRFHSTETALLKIHNDIICNMDNGKVTALTLLDLSAAFDTIDHATLLERLYGHFGISGTVLQWFKSYISNRQQRVHIDGSLSCPQDLNFGVPQGSVLGPFLFCLYTTSISQIITTHDVSHHMYADDTQVYVELSQSDTHKSISSLIVTVSLTFRYG